MKKMKKFAALLLAVSMAAGMVAQIKRKRLQKKKKPRKMTKRQRNWKEL